MKAFLQSYALLWSIGLALVVGACDSATSPLPPPGQTAVRIELQPVSRDTLEAGDTLHLRVVVTNSAGAVLKEPKVTWEGGDPPAVTVSKSGVVEVVPGPVNSNLTSLREVTVTARIDSLAASVKLKIAPTAGKLAILPVGRILLGKSRQLVVHKFTGFDHLLAHRSAKTFRWSSSDTTVATISAEGVLTAKRLGRATIQASLPGVSTSREVEVTARGYTLTYLGTLGGDSAWAHDINDRDQVVGDALTAAGEQHAFLWEAGTMRDLGTLRDWSTARAINDTGLVVGASTGLLHPTLTYAARWEAGELKAIPEFGMNYATVATAVNDAGVIAGEHKGEAFTWFAGDTLRLPPYREVSVSTHPWVDVHDIDATGAVVGAVYGSGYYSAARYSSGMAYKVGRKCGGRAGAAATAITDVGQMAGWCVDFPSFRTFGWVTGVGGSAGVYPEVIINDLNESGIFVGRAPQSGHHASSARGIVGIAGQVDDLGDLVHAEWHIEEATAVNATGKIVGYGRNIRTGARGAVLLTPEN